MEGNEDALHEGVGGKSKSLTSSKEPSVVDEAAYRKIVHRIDRRLVTVVGLMFSVSLMDRTNLSVALVADMGTDLKLKGFRYNIIILVFFPTYIIFQIPSTIIVKKLGPRLHLGTITLLWGVLMVSMGFINTWDAMAGMRVLLGILEAGFFPGCVYLLSTWYTRFDLGKRYSYFTILGSVASGFSGILAMGINKMKGLGNLSGWRWIFIIEGILTCLLAAMGFILLVGFPDDGKLYKGFLTHEETAIVIQKVDEDRGDAVAPKFSFTEYLTSAKDAKIWLFAILFFNTTTVTYALAYFMPSILKTGLHFSTMESQGLIAPPYVVAGLNTWLTGYIGDKYHIRGPIIIYNMLLCLIGLPIIGWAHNSNLRYFAIFLVTAGSHSNIPAVMTYQANNIRGHWKRAFCSATLVGLGGVGGIMGSLVFRKKDEPHWYPGIITCLACAGLNVVVVLILTLHFQRENARADRGELVIEGSEEGFRYTS